MDLLTLFWIFLKVNLLSVSGLASIGLLHHEAVGRWVNEEQFTQAVSFAGILPGSDALQLAMFIGLQAYGIPGALIALLGSLLPPTVLMLGVVLLLYRLRREAWISSFVEGLTPAVAVLMLYVAWKWLQPAFNLDWRTILLSLGSWLALQRKLPPAAVLLASGLLGILLYR